LNPDAAVDDAILQRTRFRILTLLKKAGIPLYIEQIAKDVGESSRLAAHHLEILEDLGLVKSEFGIIKDASRPVAGRFFETTKKADEALERLRMSIPEATVNE
jgi:DNA-binding transcriptional ArsR family regulator